MEIKRREQVIEIKKVITGYKCDVCKTVIETDRFPDEWHHFSSHHNEWGNDSIESYVYYDVCSPECYIKKLIKVVGEMEDIKDGEVDDMEIQFAKRMVDFFKINPRL